MIRERPIFFRPHSKAILSRAIHNDTEFLAQQMVMDYSLLVGIDEARSELVTGIIGELLFHLEPNSLFGDLSYLISWFLYAL